MTSRPTRPSGPYRRPMTMPTARRGLPAAAVVAGAAVIAVVVLLAASPPAAAAWRRPVAGAVSRPFAYSRATPFAAGLHRGADFAAPPGAVVRAACAGRVAFAGRGVVTLRCGAWRVTHLPLATLRVHAGEPVREGARLGTLAASREHAGLHLGVRRAGDRFAYVDPVPLLGHGARPPVTVVGPRGDPGPRGGPRRAPLSAPLRAPAAPRPVARVRVPPARSPAPWPVWIGLALVLSGAIGGGTRVRARKRRALQEPVPSSA